MSISRIQNALLRRTVLLVAILPLTALLVAVDIFGSVIDAFDAARDAWAGRS